jgi:uncharacterized membrane protein HdeD (DUF308 family)
MSRTIRHYSHWYLLFLRGLFLVILGLYVLFFIENQNIKLIKIFEVFTVISGLLLVQNALLNRHHKNWQFVLFNGLLDLSFGIMLWLVPELSVLSLKIAISIWFLYSGLIQMVDSMILIHDNVKNWWFELISGMLSFFLAFILIALSVKMKKELFVVVGIFTLLFGGFLMISSFFLKELKKS